MLSDRSEIVSLSAGDAITACMAQAGGGDTSGFEAQIAQLTKAVSYTHLRPQGRNLCGLDPGRARCSQDHASGRD